MSLTDDSRGADGASDRTASTEDLIDLLSDEHAREILGAIRTESKSGRTLAAECGMSRTTVYRRLNRLREAGLVTGRMEYDSDGHHRRRFEVAVERVGIELDESGFEAELAAEEA